MSSRFPSLVWRLCAGLTLVVLMEAASSPTLAQTNQTEPSAATQNAARELFEQGLALSDAGRFAEALATFQRSLALSDRASTVLNIGLMLFRTGKPVESVETLRAYLVRPDVRDDAGRRTKGQQALEASQTAIARLELDIRPATAQASIDGTVQPSPTGQRVFTLNPGPHTVALQAEGYTPRERRITLLSGQVLSLAVELQPIAPPNENVAHLDEPVIPPLQVAPQQQPVEAEGSIATKWWFWTIIGVAVAGAAVGTYFAVDAATQDNVGAGHGVLLSL